MNKPYKVGYKKPPIYSRFVKGASGNPKGRRPKDKDRWYKPIRSVCDIQERFIRLAEKKIPVTINGKRRMITRIDAVVELLLAKALSNHTPSMRLVFKSYYQYAEADELLKHGILEPLIRRDLKAGVPLAQVMKEFSAGPDGYPVDLEKKIFAEPQTRRQTSGVVTVNMTSEEYRQLQDDVLEYKLRRGNPTDSGEPPTPK